MNRFLNILIILCIPLFANAEYKGKVFVDSNKNGVYDNNETLVKGAVVSDGYNIVKTNSKGEFKLKGWDKARFVTIYTSASYTCEKRFIPVKDGKSEYNFSLQTKQAKKKVSFVQISDTETFEHREWVDELKEYSKTHKPDFIVHTGDICYKSGMYWHSRNLTDKQVNVPVYYCLGNHDMIKGDYGEQYFEKCFGPAWYAFEEGNTLFVITPMMGGDYKPSFNRKDIGGWLKNLLKTYPKKQPKIFFNHDLLTNGEEFSFKISKKDKVNLNKYNLKAWLYGHWHINMAKKHNDAGIMSYGTATIDKGGIDHSPSSYRIINVDDNGDTYSHMRWSYHNKQISIVSPNSGHAYTDKNGDVNLSVNIYHSGAKVDSVRYAVWGEKGLNWHSYFDFHRWSSMRQTSDCNWNSKFRPESQKSNTYSVLVYAYLKNGTVLNDKMTFKVDGSHPSSKLGDDWTNLGGNKEHNALVDYSPGKELKLLWSQNLGGNIYMSSPVVYSDYVMSATFDDGSLSDSKIVCYNATTGEKVWDYKTINGVKNQMVVAQGLLIATDMQGYTYAIDIKTGDLKWKKDLKFNKLPGFISGIVTDGKVVYTGFGKSLSALKVEDGSVLWKNTEWSGGEGTTPTMTLANDVLIVSRHWGRIYAHDTKSGKVLWERGDEGLRFRDGVLNYTEGYLWVTSKESKLLKMDLKTGKTLERMDTDMKNNGTSAPVITSDKFYIAGSHPGIASFDRDTKKKIWQFEVGEPLMYTPSYYCDRQQSIETTPLLMKDKLIFGAMDGCVYLLDAETGKLDWKTSLGSPVITSAANSGNSVYICDFAGNIYCFITE